METQADIARRRAAQATPAPARTTTVRQAAAAQRQAGLERDAGISNVTAANVTSIAPEVPAPAAVVPPPAPTAIVPPEITSPENPLQSTTEIEQIETGTRQSAQERMNELDSMQSSFDSLSPTASDYTAFGDTAGGAAAERKMSAAEEEYADVSAGRYNEQQQARIDAATERARIAGEETVRSLEAQKKQGMAKSTVNAGEAGGFLNTQFAGIAALLPTQGNTFVGAGGELERIQSSYDGAIASAKNATLVAMEDARAATEEALRTGELTDLEIADRAYERAKTSYTEAQTLQRQKREDLINFEKTRRELIQYQREDAATTFEAMIAAGKTVDDVPEWYFTGLDAALGYAEGTSAGIYKITQDAKADQDLEADITQANNLLGVMKNMQVGGPPVTIGDTTYTLLNYGDAITGTESDGTGQYMWSVNEATGETTVSKIGAPTNKPFEQVISKEGVILHVYDDGTPPKIVYDPRQPNGGYATGGLVSSFPEGSVTPFTRAEGGLDRASECGAWVNDVSGMHLGNTYAEKLAAMDKAISADTAQIGDVVLMQSGDTGHVAFINGISTANGQTQYTLSESNWEKQPGSDGKIGLITHTRKVDADTVTGYARPGFTNPSYNFGTDANPALSGLTFGDAKTPPTAASLATVSSYAREYITGRVASGNIPAEIRDEVIKEADTLKQTYIQTPEMKALSLLGKVSADYQGPMLDALINDDKTQAQALLKGAIYESATAGTKEKIDGRHEVVDALTSIQEDLDTYEAAGGETNIFKGTMKNIEKNIGRISDPELVSIATRINAALINYRKSISGAAFTPSEAAEYERLLPSIKNVPELNSTIISTLLDTFSDAENTFYSSRLGAANYEQIFGEGEAPANQSVVESPEDVLAQYPEYSDIITQMIDEGEDLDFILEALNSL